MTVTFTTDNIDRLHADALEPARGWRITFRSTNEGMHHQMYVNGRLADFTDTTHQRSFLLDAQGFAQQVVIAAVETSRRASDMSPRLAKSLRDPGWAYSALVLRTPELRTGGRIEVLGDHTTGQMDSDPLLVRRLSPSWSPRWGFGDDVFGTGAMGYDGSCAVGIGKGAFGAGAFGIDAQLAAVSGLLGQEGSHQIVLRVVTPAGEYTDGQVDQVPASLPPTPPESLAVTDYDKQNKELTLQIQ